MIFLRTIDNVRLSGQGTARKCTISVHEYRCTSHTPTLFTMETWNPPAPEKEEAANGLGESDAIGDSVFSKSWVLSALAKAVSFVISPEGGEKDREAAVTEHVELEAEAKESVERDEAPESYEQHLPEEDSTEQQDEELSSDVEEELCQLWDASAIVVSVVCDIAKPLTEFRYYYSFFL